ncbi:MAG: ferritin-like domain-containing protein [Marinifilaceae bacterium]
MAQGNIDVLKGKIDVQKVIDLLNAALAEEWLAFYQYWVGAIVVRGPERAGVQKELEEHAGEEYQHANLIAARIIELGGQPVMSPEKWFDLARCKYEAPTDESVFTILQQNIRGERCAIRRYEEIAEFTDGKDFTTCELAKHILAEEEEHEQDLQDFVDDLEDLKKYIKP